MPKPIEVPKTREPSSQQHIQVCWAPGKDERISGNSSSLAMLMMSKLQILQNTDLLHSRQTWRPKEFKHFSSKFRSLPLATNPHQPLSYLLWKIMANNSTKVAQWKTCEWQPLQLDQVLRLLESKLRNWRRIRRSDPARCRSLQPAIWSICARVWTPLCWG